MKKMFEYVEGLTMLLVLIFVCVLLRGAVLSEQYVSVEQEVIYEND